MSCSTRTLALVTTLPLILTCASAPTLPPEAAIPLVATDAGEVQGVWAAPGEGMAVFKGIPYAAPPLADLRFQPPAPVEPWQEVRQATEFAPACPQLGLAGMWLGWLAGELGGDPEAAAEIARVESIDEGCLYLNVWTPDLDPDQPAPVIVWSHGGGHNTGTASTSYYDGRRLAARGAVVVTLNYRLGALGSLALPALSAESPHGTSGNYQLLDHIAALQWIQANIQAFGGDPQRVTLMGESAGALNVVYLLSSPLAEGLFHRAIAQSPMGASSRYAKLAGYDLDWAESQGQGYLQRLGLTPGPGDLSALREKSADDLVAATRSLNPLAPPPYTPRPVVDGRVVPAAPHKAFAQGRHHSMPLLIGATANEGSSLWWEVPQTETAFQEVMRAAYLDLTEDVISIYAASEPEAARQQAFLWYADDVFAAARYFARAMTATGSPAYLYRFTRVPPPPGDTKLGAYHGSDLAFVFGNHFPDAFPTGPGDETLTDAMMTYWVQFAATGNPNAEGLPHWPTYDPKTDPSLELDHEIKAANGFRREACDLLERVLNPD